MSDLEMRALGESGLSVSVLGFGSMELRGPPRGRHLTEAEVGRVLNLALDSGMTVIDTSIDYEWSEERIGRHVGHRRDEYLLASKCGCLVGWERPTDYKGGMAGGGPHDFSRENIVAGVEQSLRRLRTDHLDLVQVHASPDLETLTRYDVPGTLDDLKWQGKARLIGMSGTLPDIEDHIALGVFDVFQIPYSAVQREHESVITMAAAAGAGVLVRGGAARGAPSAEQRAVKKSPSLAERWEEASMDEIIGDMSPMEFTLRFTISHPGVSCALVGTADPGHLAANVASVARGPLPPKLYEAAKRRFRTD